MNNPPKPKNELERLKALRNHAILDTPNEDEFDRITELASLLCNVPIAMVSLIDDKRQWLKSRFGLDAREAYRDLSFCQYTILDTGLFEITDALQDSRFNDNPLVTGKPNLRYYAGYPLIDQNGFSIGTLSVLDHVPNQLNYSQKKALELLSLQVTTLIVERREKEELKHFEKIFTLSSELICTADIQNGLFQKVNPAFTAVLGWSTDFMLRTSLYELIHPEDRQRTAEELRHLCARQQTITLTHRCRTSTGTYKTILWTVTPELSTNFLYGIGRDITAESIKEERLINNEEKLRVFFENSQGLMCTHDLEGNLISFNQAGAAMLGYDVAQMNGRSLYDIMPRSRQSNVTDYLADIKQNGQSKGQMLIQHKDGNTRIWQYNNVITTDSEGNKYVIGNAIDVNDRFVLINSLQRTTEMLMQTNKVARVGGWEYDFMKEKLYWSEVMNEIHGIDSEDEVGNPLDFYTPQSRVQINKALMDAINEGHSWDLELQIITARGKEIWVQVKGYAEWEEGVCSRVFGTFQDINNIVLQREELQAAKLLSEQANGAKSEFLANMSHEIRTPLNGVIGFTDLMLKTALTETQLQYLSIISQSADSLLGIINDILDFSKIEAGKLDLDIEKCDLHQLVSDATDIITYGIQNKGLELLLNLSPNLPRFIWTDAIRLKQVLINLLGNAAKFTEQGEIELKIDAFSCGLDHSTLRISIRDTGIGIPEDKQKTIFEAFSQEDSSTTKKYGGTGLGLTISSQLLALMGSKLKLDSSPGQFSVFYFDLTLRSEQGYGLSCEGIEFIKRVLIVDDNENNRLILREMLKLKGIECKEAENGIEALSILENQTGYDVVLMDYHMPYMHGLETIRRIRTSGNPLVAKLPIVLLHSSSDDEQVIQACDEFDVNYHLLKPVKMQNIYHTLSQLHKNERGYAAVRRGDDGLDIITKAISILIVEDNLVNMLLAKTILKRIMPNADLYTSENGYEALQFCKLHLPDLIFMDIQMPVMNGYEATKKIRLLVQDGRVPIIALTAGTLNSERDRCFEAGVDDLVTKPFVEDNIRWVLNKWVV